MGVSKYITKKDLDQLWTMCVFCTTAGKSLILLIQNVFDYILQEDAKNILTSLKKMFSIKK